jgi:hypothetical protein
MNESGPSAHFRQHHDVEAPCVDDRHFRPAWRVLTRLDGLLADKAITPPNGTPPPISASYGTGCRARR